MIVLRAFAIYSSSVVAVLGRVVHLRQDEAPAIPSCDPQIPIQAWSAATLPPWAADSGSGTFSDGKPLTALLTPLRASVNPDWNGCIKSARGAVSMDCPMIHGHRQGHVLEHVATIAGVSTPPSNLTCSRLGDRTSKLALALTEDSSIGALNATRFSTRPPTPSMVWVMSPTLRPGRFSAASKNITSLFDVYTRRHLPDKTRARRTARASGSSPRAPR